MKRSPSIILGINYGHGDSSAALIIDGKLVAAAEEERFNRIKHYALFPTKAIEYCLNHAKVRAKDVRVIAIPKRPRAHWAQKLKLFLRHPHLAQMNKKTPFFTGKEPSIRAHLKPLGLKSASINRIEHHLAHLMSARYLSREDNLALLSLDGLGDFVSATIGKASPSEIEILDRTYFPHSLGFFYSALTMYLGFPHFGDEYKVMGLSSYGKPRYLKAMKHLIRESTQGFGFELNLEAFPLLKKPLGFHIDRAQPKMHPFYNVSLLTQIIGIPPRKPHEDLTQVHWDLAKSVQVRFEEIANHVLHQLHERIGGTSVAISGGCAHNSVWVGKIPQLTPYKQIHVAPAANDAGLAVGAAITASTNGGKGQIECEEVNWALLGPSTESPLSESLPSNVEEQNFSDEKKLIQWMVEQLCEQKIIGLVHGRMEFGPRALGHRSILADPRFSKMREYINQKIKHREKFRPFAASVLRECQQDWFKECFDSPHMEAVFEVKENVRARVQAVVHVDNSCRIQSVTQKSQPFYWSLLDAFRKKTGIPMLLNTSFNDREPIVCTENDAFRCFLRGDMDHLVIGTRVFSRVAKSMSLAG